MAASLLRRSAACLTLVLASGTGCGGGSGGDTGPVGGPVPPVSGDPPLTLKSELRPPSEPREVLLGDVAVVVDSGLHAVYEFDLGRMRFRGPARRVVLGDEQTTTGGYPVVVSRGPAQQAAAVGDVVVVAGGPDGTLTVLERKGADLVATDVLGLPARNVVDAEGKAYANVPTDTGKPNVKRVSRFGRHRVLAVTRDAVETSVGYVVDVAARRLVKGAQLPGGGRAVSVDAYGEGAVAAMTSGKLVLLDPELASTREFALPGEPRHVAVDGDVAWASVRAPARLVRVDLRSGETSVVSEAEDDRVGGPVAVDADGTVFWALGKGALRRLPLHGKPDDVEICRDASSMVRHGGRTMVTCSGPKQFAVVPDGGGAVLYPAGMFPVSVVVPPPAREASKNQSPSIDQK